MSQPSSNSVFINKPVKARGVFAALWLLLFILYFPAARAGFVSDFTGWLDQIRNHTFYEYINRTNFKVVSLYQFTQLVTWVYYQLFGVNAWMWHLLFITMHAFNASIIYKLCAGMLQDTKLVNYKVPVLIGCALFCVTPYVSEVIVWEPSFHYLLGLMLLLVIMLLVRRYIYEPRARYVLVVWVLYALSTHSLEVFYVTPWFVLLLGIFYKYQSPQGSSAWGGVVFKLFVPMLLLFVLRLVEYRVLHGDWVSRIGSETALSLKDTGLGKPAKYLFHLLLLGRYLPEEWQLGGVTLGEIRTQIYNACDSTAGIAMFYTFCVLAFAWGMFRYKYMSGRARVALIVAGWAMIALLLITPLWFGDLLLVVYDRYTYFAGGFVFVFVAICLTYIDNKKWQYGIIAVLLLANLRYSVQVVRYWWKSENIISRLLNELPVQDDKIVILLNVPDSMHGVLMIGSSDEGEYKMMRNLLLPGKAMHGPVHEAMSYNMATPNDGAHVRMLNDSTVRVVLNQYATWWWYSGLGGHDHEHADYKARITNDGYEMVMKKPASQYALYYQVGSQWKRVDMSRTYEQY